MNVTPRSSLGSLRYHALRIVAGLLIIAVVLVLMTPLLLPDPWDIVYAVTVGVLGAAYLLGKDCVHG